MSDFTERARAEAERRMAAQREQVGLMVHEQQRYIEGFRDGARWARGVLMADPTDAEVEAAARAFYEDPSGLTDWRKVQDVEPWLADRYRVAVERAVVAFLAARRGSE